MFFHDLIISLIIAEKVVFVRAEGTQNNVVHFVVQGDDLTVSSESVFSLRPARHCYLRVQVSILCARPQ